MTIVCGDIGKGEKEKKQRALGVSAKESRRRVKKETERKSEKFSQVLFFFFAPLPFASWRETVSEANKVYPCETNERSEQKHHNLRSTRFPLLAAS
jgi:hypothetical protein